MTVFLLGVGDTILEILVPILVALAADVDVFVRGAFTASYSCLLDTNRGLPPLRFFGLLELLSTKLPLFRFFTECSPSKPHLASFLQKHILGNEFVTPPLAFFSVLVTALFIK